ncbi:MAG TPA: transposase [Gemmatimonadales bacterium]
MRQRETLLSAAAPGIQHRHKALTDMNGQLANVLRDISGVTGLAMLRALLAGARDPATLAALTDDRSNANPHTIANSLEGNWRAAVLFNLRQSLELDDVDQQNSAACDARLDAPLHTFDTTIEVQPNPAPPSTRRPKKARRHEPPVAVRTARSRISGGDVTRIDGIAVLTAQPRMAEIGLAMRRWKTEQHLAAWRGVWPDHRISGGKGLTRGTRDVGNRAADALRLAAQHLLHRQRALGANDRRLRARRGAPQAITALAHPRARLVYRLRKCGPPYRDKGRPHDAARFRQQRLPWLPRQAREVTLQLVPNQPVPSGVS